MPAVDISPVSHYAPRRHVYLYMSVCLSLSHGQYDHDIITQRDRHVHTHTHHYRPLTSAQSASVGQVVVVSRPRSTSWFVFTVIPLYMDTCICMV